MKCEKVLSKLSQHVDDMLSGEQALQVEAHLQHCPGCRKEFDRFTVLKVKLSSLRNVGIPRHMGRVLAVRLESLERESLRVRMREGLEFWWSRVRTLEGMWYWTRALGTVTTFVFFFALYTAMSPMAFESPAGASNRSGDSRSLQQQVVVALLKNFGLTPVDAQKRPISSTDPMINELYLLYFGQSTMRVAKDDSFSVVTAVDSNGAVTIRDILEYPMDENLLNDFSTMIANARYRPASQNGRAVDSHLVLSFSKISVHD